LNLYISFTHVERRANMPVIKVWCLPPNQNEEALNRLHQTIVGAVCKIRELGFRGQEDMTCLFVPDLMQYGLGGKIIIEIGGFFNKAERTPGFCQRLALSVGTSVCNLYRNARVECFVQTFDPVQGFWASPEPERCPECGGRVTRNGTCVKCFSCNWSQGCS